MSKTTKNPLPDDPSADGANGGGRDGLGRFAAGNSGGPGNPHGRQVAKLRAALLEAVTPEDLREIVEKLVESAKAGSIQAAHELLDRCLGKPEAVDLAIRVAELEELLAEIESRGRAVR